MPVDTSFYPAAKQAAPPNMLEMAGTAVGLQGHALQNQLLQRTMGSQQAIGQAYANHMRDDGTVDTGAAMQEAAGNPAAAFGMQEGAEHAATLQQQQLANALTHAKAIYSVAGSLADKPDLSMSDVQGGVTDLMKMGIISAKEAATEIAQIPQDPNGMRSYLRSQQMRMASAMEQIGAYHNPGFMDTGSQLTPVNTAPLAQQQPLDKTLSPEAATSPVSVTDPAGTPQVTTRENFAKNGTMQAGLRPGAAAAQAVSGTGNAQQGLELQRSAEGMPDIKGMLGNMSGDLKQFQTGPGASSWKHFLGSLGFWGIKADPNAVASQENFNKFSTMLAQRQFQLLGGTGTDQQLGSAISANPNEAISKLGNQRIIAMLKGNADAIALKNQLWQKYQQQPGQGGESYGQFSTSFNKKYDPRAFQMPYLSGEERKLVLDGMNQAEKTKFTASYTYAKQHGWISK